MTIKAKHSLGWIKDGGNSLYDLLSLIGVMMSSVAQNGGSSSFQCCTSFCMMQQPFYPSMGLSIDSQGITERAVPSPSFRSNSMSKFSSSVPISR